jgi:hypothetical protein
VRPPVVLQHRQQIAIRLDPTWAKLVRTFGVDRGECMADVFG